MRQGERVDRAKLRGNTMEMISSNYKLGDVLSENNENLAGLHADPGTSLLHAIQVMAVQRSKVDIKLS